MADEEEEEEDEDGLAEDEEDGFALELDELGLDDSDGIVVKKKGVVWSVDANPSVARSTRRRFSKMI